MFRISFKKPMRMGTTRVRCSHIYQPYFERYSAAICGNVPLRDQEACITHMKIPDFQVQQDIVSSLESLKSTMDLVSAEGAAMLLLKEHDLESLQALLDALEAYHDALSQIQAIVLDTLSSTI